MNRKILTKILIASMLAGGINVAPAIVSFDAGNLKVISVANAEIKNYTASDTAMFDFGEDDEKIVNTVKEFAKMRAEQAAKEKAGVYLKSFSKTVNGILTEDDISVVTNNTAEILDVKYKKTPYQAHDAQGNDMGKIGVMYEATVTIRVDTNEISKYMKMSPQEKLNLLNQNKNLKKSNEKINNDFENLRKQSETFTNAQIIIEFYKIENKVLSQQKIYEGNRLYYRKDYKGAISKYEEAFKLNPEYEEANYNREIADNSLKNNNSSRKNVDLKNYSEFNGHYYKIFNEGLTWQQAKKRCEELGGHLATITSQAEQNFVQDLLMMNGAKNSYWLGGYKSSNGNWRWITNENFSYTHWTPYQPDNFLGNENTLMMYNGVNPMNPANKIGDWNDVKSDGNCNNEPFFGMNNFGYICEWDSISAVR